MDPNVQVAIATVVGTTITTLGVVGVALIQSRRGNGKSDEGGEKSKTELHAYVQALVLENAKYQRENQQLRDRVAELEAEKEKDNIQEDP